MDRVYVFLTFVIEMRKSMEKTSSRKTDLAQDRKLTLDHSGAVV